MAEEKTEVSGPYPLWKIVIRRPKPPEATVPQMRMTPDPRKPTTQAPEMEVWGEIPVSMQHPDGTQRTEGERDKLLRRIVEESRPDLPSDCFFELVPVEQPFFWIMGGVPKITNCCPDHPDQHNNFCRKCGRKITIGLKAT